MGQTVVSEEPDQEALEVWQRGGVVVVVRVLERASMRTPVWADWVWMVWRMAALVWRSWARTWAREGSWEGSWDGGLGAGGGALMLERSVAAGGR